MISTKIKRPLDFLRRKCETAVTNNYFTSVLMVVAPMWDVQLPPLETSYLAAYLEKHGIATDILDINAEIYRKSDPQVKGLWKMEHYSLWADPKEFRRLLTKFNADIDGYVQYIIDKKHRIVGLSLYGSNILFVIEIINRLKKRFFSNLVDESGKLIRE